MSVELPDWTVGEPRILVWECQGCEHVTALPHVQCPACSVSVTPRQASGVGECFARTVLHPRASGDCPIVLVLVKSEEGAVIMGRADSGVAVGDQVRAGFAHVGVDDALVPVFTRTAGRRS
jgi:uncharacterized OB-fold protein